MSVLFDTAGEIFESYKERNLYYKYFAGYFFNDLIPDWEKRFGAFRDILMFADRPLGGMDLHQINLDPVSSQISFDNHECQFKGMKGRGEFADILVHDRVSNTLVVVEAKLYSSAKAKKDIVENVDRLRRLFNDHPKLKIIQCYLIPKKDQTRLIDQIKQNQKSFEWLQSVEGTGPLVLNWEAFLDLTEFNEQEEYKKTKKFAKYLIELPKKNRKYCIDNSAIKRNA